MLLKIDRIQKRKKFTGLSFVLMILALDSSVHESLDQILELYVDVIFHKSTIQKVEIYFIEHGH